MKKIIAVIGERLAQIENQEPLTGYDFIPRGHKPEPFRARIRFGRLVFRQWESRALARGGSIHILTEVAHG